MPPINLHDKSLTLCQTCTNGRCSYDRSGLRRVSCSAGIGDRPIDFVVERCTSYYERGRKDRRDYEETAWIIVPSGVGRIGFVRPGTAEHKKALDR